MGQREKEDKDLMQLKSKRKWSCKQGKTTIKVLKCTRTSMTMNTFAELLQRIKHNGEGSKDGQGKGCTK